MTFKDEIADIYSKYRVKRQKERELANASEIKKQETYVNEIINKAKEKIKERARHGYTEYIVIKHLNTDAEHHSPRTTTFKNVCYPEDIKGGDRLVYQKLVDLGFNPIIEYWQEKDYDEPLAYIAGYQLKVEW